MFYLYTQNNSGGVYKGPECVIVSAETFGEANKKAVNSGYVYFNGGGKRRGLPLLR